jgi:KUP system potassium uptake protein
MHAQLPPNKPTGKYLFTLSLAALGVVYGDIGTSPLYALKECFSGHYGIHLTQQNVFGVLSLIFWSLIIVISIKYLVFVLRADNHGEGGILSLTALATPIKTAGRGEKRILIFLGIFGAALLYGDGIITPAISILGALEGLIIATPLFNPYVVPLTVIIVILLFLFQSYGTAGVGKVFGPVMALWFITLAILGLAQIIKNPAVFLAINPLYGINFFIENGWHGFLVLGSVFLVVTGGEALYADMGHFGIRPIRIDWFILVLPSLFLNYFGQGALLLTNPEARENPFFHLVPSVALYPMVVLSIAAAVIASQAVISGAFSLSMQAVQLGLCPRLKIVHTSTTEYGQIYIPYINWALMIGCITIVLSFRSSSNLAAAYGIAVTSTMVITTILLFVVKRDIWKWGFLSAASLAILFLLMDTAFFGANIVKVTHGGWLPLLIAGIIFTLMITWKQGRHILAKRLQEQTLPIDQFLKEVLKASPIRVEGTAIYMTGNPSGTPPALINNLKHNKVLHEKVVILTVGTKQVPHVPEEERITVEPLGNSFYSIHLKYGYMEEPDIPKALKDVEIPGIKFNESEASYFLGRETVIATKQHGMALWRERLFALMSRNATSATAYFCLPTERVVEMGAQVEI